MGDTTLTRGGQAISVPDEQVGPLLERGYTVETPEQQETREEGELHEERDPGMATSAAMGALRGATLGGSDAIARLLGGEDAGKQLAEIQGYHPITSMLGEIGGAVLGGELAPFAPSGLVSKAGGAIADLGEGASFAGRTAARVAAGAAEGSAYGAGGYVSDVALGNKDLSADGFTAAMGQGALWGGVAGGALSVASDALANARKLFPKEELTREAVDAATKEATDHVSFALDDADAMHLAAKRALREMRGVEIAQNPMLGDQLESVAQAHLEANPDGAGLEDAVNREYAKANPYAEQIVRAGQELAESKAAVKQWLGEEPALKIGPTDIAPPKSWDPTQPLDIVAEDLPGHGAAPAPTGIDPLERLSKVLGRSGSSGDVNADLERAADVLTRHEAAAADMVEALGPGAPPRAMAQAQAFREAQQSAEQRTAQSVQQAAQDVAKAAPHMDVGLPPPRAGGGFADDYASGAKPGEIAKLEAPKMGAPASKSGGLLGMLKQAGGAKALGMLGVAVHALKAIPVIGPVLSTVAHSMLLGKAFGRFGGKVAETAETVIAGKHAETMNRMAQAISDIFEKKGGKIATTGGAVAALGHKLFDAGPPQATPYSSTAKESDLMEAFRARANEVVASQAPGAVHDAVAARVKTSDPAVLDALVAAQQRKLDFLYSVLPKPDAAPALIGGLPFTPSKADISNFARAVKAVDDPMSVVEKVAGGGIVTPDEVKALSVCYPQLYGELQKSVIEKAAAGKSDMPPARQKQLSTLVGMPMDASSNPALGVFLQQHYAASGSPAPQPQPSINPTAVFRDRVSNRLDMG